MTTQRNSKLKCDECKITFSSESELEQHMQRHSDTYCTACPIDVTIYGIKKLFQKNKK